jgi:hypothetical protein
VGLILDDNGGGARTDRNLRSGRDRGAARSARWIGRQNHPSGAARALHVEVQADYVKVNKGVNYRSSFQTPAVCERPRLECSS